MQFNADLTGDAAALARTHSGVLARLPATVSAFILVELTKWPLLFPPEQRYQRALLEHLSRIPADELERSVAGIARVEAEAGASQDRRAQPGAVSRRGAGAAAQARPPGRVAQRSGRALSENRSGARGAALSRRRAAPPDRPDLRPRDRGAAGEIVEPVQARRPAGAAQPRRRSRHRTVSRHAVRRRRESRHDPGAPRRRDGSSKRTKRFTRCSTEETLG